MNRENFINFISGIGKILSLGWHFVWYLECRVNNLCGQVLNFIELSAWIFYWVLYQSSVVLEKFNVSRFEFNQSRHGKENIIDYHEWL